MTKLSIPGMKIVETSRAPGKMYVRIKLVNRWAFACYCWRYLNEHYVIPWRLKPEMFVRLVWSVYRDN